MTPALQAALESLPEKPGCYLFKDARAKVIYVGKAVDLRRRVRSYFQASQGHTPKTRALAAAAAALETVVTLSEVEALILEENLIKRFRPRYNVLWKDDKRYPYLQLTLSEPYPRLLVTRRPHEAQDRYDGPFVHVWAMRRVERLAHRYLGIRQCDIEITRDAPRPCLYYDLHQCDAPCVAWGETKEQYAGHVKRVQLLLEGKDQELARDLEARMHEASAAERYEEAAHWRDSLQAIQEVASRQRIVLPEPIDADIFALSSPGATVFFVRGGKLIDWQSCRLSNLDTSEPGEAMASFVLQFYAGGAVPDEVILAHDVDEPEALGEWLSRKRGSKVRLSMPKRGDKRALVRMVEENAREMLKEGLAGEPAAQEARIAPGKDLQGGLEELAKVLGLPGPPRRIEGFDISHLQGSQTVASMVVMVNGAPARREYRHYKVKTVEGVDDFASMEEVVGRRYRRVLAEGLPRPDLVLIDGGPGQLGAAQRALKALGLEGLPCVGLAKRFEELFVPGRPQSLRLDERSPGRLLVQRLRDEAHRFAISFHRRLRAKALVRSKLDEIPGVGPAIKRRLLKAFGSPEGVRQAGEAGLAQVQGVGPSLAAKILAHLSGAP